MTQPFLLLTFISGLGLLGIVSAIFDWPWIYRSAGARLLTALVGRPAMRLLTGLAGLLFLLAPWLLLLTRP